MSALRISRPGYPTELIILEPAIGRISHSRMAIHGSLVTQAVVVKRTPEQVERQREADRRYYAAHKTEAMERQRRYRGRGRAISIRPENRL